MATTARAKARTKRRRRGPPPSPSLSRPDYPYTMRLPDGRTVAVEVPGRWVSADRDGTPVFEVEAGAFLDRVRALFTSSLDKPASPGYIARLREGLGMTQEQFAQRVGVDKMTVARWEWGKMRPSAAAVKAIEKVRKQALRRGVTLEG